MQELTSLCKHVLQHGTKNWDVISSALQRPVNMCALKWYVLHLGVSSEGSSAPGRRNYGDWELAVLLRVRTQPLQLYMKHEAQPQFDGLLWTVCNAAVQQHVSCSLLYVLQSRLQICCMQASSAQLAELCRRARRSC